mmetsp:Transcript_8569/g.12771  ORF Transcript_8569/g.12771 Transcript_8569/m.12771 type:complete len:475 (+) Transcript_8569:40-1464(+)
MIKNLLALFYLVPIQAPFTSLSSVPDYIGESIPFFFLLIFLEFAFGTQAKNVTLYSMKDSIMSISLGIFQQLVTMWIKNLLIIPYILTYNYTHYWRETFFGGQMIGVKEEMNYDILYFIIGFLGCDLGYYFFHRYSHEFHLLWSTHSVHHSGNRYNLATALRQGAIQPFFSWLVYLPLAVIGLPPIHFVRHSRLNTVYQFWIHTEAVGRLPLIIELIMNTPSHHRMHHSPPGNCNYAGVLIIWDRIFGTFSSELPHQVSDTNKPDKPNNLNLQQKPPQRHPRVSIYGWARPLDSFNPLYANICHLIRLLECNTTTSSGKISYDLSSFQRLISIICKRRVKSEVYIESSLHKLVPDILQQWKLYRHWDAYWHQLFQLPPSVTDSSLITDNKKLTPFSSREVEFLLHRSQQDNGFKSKTNAITAIFLFAITLAASLFLLDQLDSTFSENGSLLEKILFVAGTLTCFYSLHVIGSIQ